MSRPHFRSLALLVALGLTLSATAALAAPPALHLGPQSAPVRASFLQRIGHTLIRLVGRNGAILDPFGLQPPPPKTGTTAAPLDDNGAILDPFGIH